MKNVFISRRVLALVLALVMALSISPASVIAAENTETVIENGAYTASDESHSQQNDEEPTEEYYQEDDDTEEISEETYTEENDIEEPEDENEQELETETTEENDNDNYNDENDNDDINEEESENEEYNDDNNENNDNDENNENEASPEAPAVGLTATIFNIGDFHGFLTSEQSASDPGAPRFVTYIENQFESYRNNTGHRPIVMLSGDNYFGQSISNLLGGEPSLRVLNRIGARYSSLGNHEFSFHNRLFTQSLAETNQAARTSLIQDINRPNPLFDRNVLPSTHHLAQVNPGITLLAADLVYAPYHYRAGQHPDWVQPYAIIDDFHAEYGVRIGVIGLTGPGMNTLVGANDRQGLHFRTPGASGTTPAEDAARYEWLEAMINRLRDHYGVSAVVALTHTAGGANDSNLAPTNVIIDTLNSRGNAHFDAWLSGHSHTYNAFVRGANTATGFLGTAIACGGHHGRGFGAVQFDFYDGELVGLRSYTHGAPDGMDIRRANPDPEVFSWVWGTGATWTRDELNLVINYESHTDAPVSRWGYVQVRNAAWDVPLGTRGLYGRNQHTRNQFLVNLAVDYIDRVHARDVSYTTGRQFDGTIITFAQSGWRGQDDNRLQWTPNDTVTYMDLKDALTFERYIPLFEMRGHDVIELLNLPGHNLAPPAGTPWGRWPTGHAYRGLPNWGTMQGQTIAGAFFHDGTWYLSATMQPINPNGVYRVGMAHNLFNGYGGDGSQRWAAPGNIQGNALGFEVIDFGYFANNPFFSYGPRHWARDNNGDPLTYWDIWAAQLEYRNVQMDRGTDIAARIEVEAAEGGDAILEVWGMATVHVGQEEGVVGSGGTTFSNHSSFGGPSLPENTTSTRGTWTANASQYVRDLVLLGTPVRVTAIPNDGQYFHGWYNGLERVSLNETYIFRSEEDVTLEARFGDTPLVAPPSDPEPLAEEPEIDLPVTLPPTLIRLQIGNLQYTINGNIFVNDVAPFIDTVYNRTMVPLAVVAESLGAEVSWVAETRTVVITRDGITLSLQADTPLPNNMGMPNILDGRTFVPVAYIAQNLGASVDWDAVNRAVYITR
ncbi:MAG: stalk domain-containing protein [Defluviitaleaceae bacterium]|nr:stalk domain-containing protein [Defluviitaleaceae bacterium]